MKTVVIKSGFVMGLCFTLFLGNAVAIGKAKDIVGTWNYTAPNAPYEYSKGKMIFTEKGSDVVGVIKLGNDEIEMKNLKIEDAEVSFGAYIEGEYVTIKAKVNKKAFTGTATYSEGSVELSGEKE